MAELEKEYWKETMSYLWHEYEDEDLKRMFQKYAILGTSALPEDLNERLIVAINNMQTTYAKATICDYHDRKKCDLHVEPGTVKLLPYGYLRVFKLISAKQGTICILVLQQVR